MPYRTIGVIAVLLLAIGFTVNAAAGDNGGCFRNDVASSPDKSQEIATSRALPIAAAIRAAAITAPPM